jgi:putative ABC transport system permease protein
MDQVLYTATARPRFLTFLLGLFAGIAVLLAAIGIYGIMSYTVAQGTREIGIRVALGAQRRDLFQMVVGRGLKLTLIGIILGVAGAFGLTRLMSNLLFGVSATDPLTFVGVAALLLIVALLASYIPARRATKVDPLVALRYE